MKTIRAGQEMPQTGEVECSVCHNSMHIEKGDSIQRCECGSESFNLKESKEDRQAI